MAGKTNVECLLQEKNNVREDMTAEGLSPSLQNKLSTVSCDNENGICSPRKEMQVLHYVSLCKLYT